MAINLEKGQRINLAKSDGAKLQNICVGINWGAIQKKGMFGFGSTTEAVDLDGSCALFSEDKRLEEVVYFGNLKSKNNSVRHSGDDLTGDIGGDDGLDNEVITVELSNLPATTTYVAFVLNSFRGQDFASIPFASIRIYEGTPKRVNEVFAKYDIANSANFAGHVSMVLGVFYKKNGEWKFNALGEPTRDRKLEETVRTVAANFL
ncbi:TerD family protein [Mucilaginibacter myungsuensis]|uniref:Tellurium resistance TerZ family protein n=1 Tax=Mucilaginibacter myungsuensis TaxID=649104 RepID=A0A929PY30_9SPHI|nr:TerD family protein [Mucilaginibacter myungsuensis]MBE9663754.1 tellurium resistance TerZ family protein [Mucilaginibacter myungsuensis]MDN3598920.1 TerD family protein [Mucilaginibacter myungsuensis]